MRIRWLALGLLVAGTAGCDALGISAGNDEQRTALVTGGAEFELADAFSGRGVGTDIPIGFINPYDEPVYIVNCNGQLAPLLEKRVDGEWVEFWHGISDMCLSPPIVIQPRAAFSRLLQVRGAYPGRDVLPEWASSDVAGEYRLVLNSMVFDFDPDGRPFGTDVPRSARTSNTFRLIQP
ncbi:MAG: hypothetical protein WEB88_06605 [Gemmatimonadota bacterium]